MPRRGENIYKRKDGRWEGRYIVDRRPDGRAIYHSIYGPTYGEVRQKLKTQQDGQRAFCQLAGGERSGQAHHPGTVSGID